MQSGAEEADRELPTVADALRTPLPGECLLCYVWRMLDDFGCNATLRWARRWRETRAPRATALEHRLGRRGGFCDCQIFLNGWELVRSAEVVAECSLRDDPGCRGVRPGSTQPCVHWVCRAFPGSRR